jgi:CheY-like chemotaxis protein
MILVATGDSATRIDLARIVARLGLRTLATFDGDAALAAAQTYGLELLGMIVDSDLPSASGRDITSAIRRVAGDLPLIVLDRTGGAMPCSDPQYTLAVAPNDMPRIAAFLQRVADTLPVAHTHELVVPAAGPR